MNRVFRSEFFSQYNDKYNCYLYTVRNGFTFSFFVPAEETLRFMGKKFHKAMKRDVRPEYTLTFGELKNKAITCSNWSRDDHLYWKDSKIFINLLVVELIAHQPERKFYINNLSFINWFKFSIIPAVNFDLIRDKVEPPGVVKRYIEPTAPPAWQLADHCHKPPFVRGGTHRRPQTPANIVSESTAMHLFNLFTTVFD